LQAEGMKIGLISHVEELKNRLEKKLIVERPADGIGGTRVSLS
jgi:DNA repair exonuclease SbcCD ATPase subunit